MLTGVCISLFASAPLCEFIVTFILLMPLLQPPNGKESSAHEMVVRTFDSPTKCDACTSVMFGLVRQGMMCKSEPHSLYTCTYTRKSVFVFLCHWLFLSLFVLHQKKGISIANERYKPFLFLHSLTFSLFLSSHFPSCSFFSLLLSAPLFLSLSLSFFLFLP